MPDSSRHTAKPRRPKAAEIPAHVLAEYRPWLESPKAVAAELGITTAECLARAREGRDFRLHIVHEGPVVWIYRPHRRAAAQGLTT